jgi:hypothetical protein
MQEETRELTGSEKSCLERVEQEAGDQSGVSDFSSGVRLGFAMVSECKVSEGLLVQYFQGK